MQRINSCLRGELKHAYGYSSEREARRYTCSRAATLICTRFRPAGGPTTCLMIHQAMWTSPISSSRNWDGKYAAGRAQERLQAKLGRSRKKSTQLLGLSSSPHLCLQHLRSLWGAQNHEIREPWGGPECPDSPTGGFCRSFSTQKD